VLGCASWVAKGKVEPDQDAAAMCECLVD